MGLYYSAETRWSDRIRTTLGARFDRYDFDVASNLPENSGTANEMLLSPKANLIYSLGKDTELYASAGRGFHGNDARGTTVTLDPTTPARPPTRSARSCRHTRSSSASGASSSASSTSRPRSGCSISTPSDITYWYASRLPGEPAAGVDDYHFHPIEPRDVRAYFTWKF